MSTSNRKRHAVAWVLAVLSLVAIVLVGRLAHDTFGVAHGPGGGSGDAPLADPSNSFAISGDLTVSMYPGVTNALNLNLTNPEATDLTVSDFHVTISQILAPKATAAHSCALRDFTVTQAPQSIAVVVGPGAERTLSDLRVPQEQWPRVGMVNASYNQDGCKGASLTLAYSASGTHSN